MYGCCISAKILIIITSFIADFLCGCILYSPRWTALPCVLLIMEPVTLAPSRITSSRLWVFVGCVLIHVLSAVTMVTCYFTSMM